MLTAKPIVWRSQAPLVVFDHGHAGRTGRKPPATYTDPESGLVMFREDVLSLAYGSHAIETLRLTGVDAVWLGPGTYEDRQRRARDMGADLAVMTHVNSGASAILAAGNPLRGGLFYDHRASSRGGKGAALAIKGKCSAALGGGWYAHPCKPGRTEWTAGAFSLLEHLGAVPGVVFEPGYIDAPEHFARWTPNGLRQLGEALAFGVLDFLIYRGLAEP